MSVIPSTMRRRTDLYTNGKLYFTMSVFLGNSSPLQFLLYHCKTHGLKLYSTSIKHRLKDPTSVWRVEIASLAPPSTHGLDPRSYIEHLPKADSVLHHLYQYPVRYKVFSHYYYCVAAVKHVCYHSKGNRDKDLINYTPGIQLCTVYSLLCSTTISDKSYIGLLLVVG